MRLCASVISVATLRASGEVWRYLLDVWQSLQLSGVSGGNTCVACVGVAMSLKGWSAHGLVIFVIVSWAIEEELSPGNPPASFEEHLYHSEVG